MTRQEGKSEEESLPFSEPPKGTEQGSSERSTALKTGSRPARRQDRGRPAGEAFILRKIARRKLYQDEIYGSKELSPLAVALIDTPEFQRLGHIYQLGMTHTIFRGATHRRLDHSVGTYFMSRTLMRRIVQNHARLHTVDPDAFAHPGRWLSPRLYLDAPGTPPEDQRRYSPMGRWRGLTEVVSAAALLHDIGHVPVGHTLEDEFSVFDKHDDLGGSRLFEFLYGPRDLSATGKESQRPVDRLFEPVDKTKLPRPDQHDLRVSLPWVFEDGIYDRFLPDARPSASDSNPLQALSNWEIRDLVYLILSFKETINDDEFRDFDAELKEAQREATEKNDAGWLARVKFISNLYETLSKPVELGATHERLPLFHPFMSDVISNTICADLLDYLVRDGQRLRLDIRSNPRLQRYLVVRPESSFVKSRQKGRAATIAPQELRLTINAVYRNGLPRRDTVSDLLDLMRERHRFAEVVYYHPKKCAFSTMFAKALELAESYRPRDGAGAYPAPWSNAAAIEEDKPHIVHLGDESLLAYLEHPSPMKPDPRVAALVRRINYRDEYRLLFTLDYEAANEAGGSPRKIIRHLREEGGRDRGRNEWEHIFSEMLGRTELRKLINDGLPPILIYCPTIRMQAKEVAARVELMPKRVIPLNQQHEDQTLRHEIQILNEEYQRLWRLYLFVHPRLAPSGQYQTNEKVTFLSAVVDAFCERYGVTPVSRSRGARFDDYRAFRDRLDDYLPDSCVSLPADSPQRRIRKIARDLGLWAAALERPSAPFPVSTQEYDTGFAQAVVTAAAENASFRQREEWPEPLRDFQVADWYREARTSTGEAARLSALNDMAEIATSLCRPVEGASQREPALQWDEFTRRVSNAVKGSGSRH